MVSLNCRVGIIGAGTSGVYLASLLAKQGYQVDLFEKAPEARTDGCGILLVSSGMKALHQGNPQLCQKIINSGVSVKNFEFRNLNGKTVSSESVTYEDNEFPGMLVHRRFILEALLESLPPQKIHLDATFESVRQTGQGVTVSFSNGSQWEGDILVGADGIYSKVREFVVPGVEPCYLGDVVWRGVVENQSFCQEGQFILYIRDRGIYSNFFDIGDGCTHWGFFIEYEQDDAEKGLPRPHNSAIPRAELAKLPDEARAVIESTPTEQIVYNFSYDIDPLPQLHKGRILLIGDAAHAKSPSRARGMTAGFEDALAFSRYLASSTDVEEAIKGFEDERIPIVHKYQQTSREISRETGRVSK